MTNSAQDARIAPRFWERPDVPLPRDGQGFLANTAGAETLETLQRVPCLALLGDAGGGKTFELKRWSADREHVFLADLRKFVTEIEVREQVFRAPKLLEWLAWRGDFELVLDGLDESAPQVTNIANILLDELQRLPRGQLRVRIACRTSEWPPALDAGLRALFGNDYQVYRLAPLRRVDLSALAGERATLVENFIRVGHAPVASSPLLLSLLVEILRVHAAFPISWRGVYRHTCLGLLEMSPGAHRAASRLLIAERIAAVLLLGQYEAINVGSDPAVSGQVSIGELAGGVEQDGAVEVAVDGASLCETLESALYARKGPAIVFMHEAYAEFLAAEFLERRKVSLERCEEIFLKPDAAGGVRVPIALRGVAAWVGAKNSEFFSRVARVDPEVFLASTAMIDDRRRAELTEQILRLAQGKELWDGRDWYRFDLGVLEHPGLKEQLSPAIEDRASPLAARRIALRIAQACRTAALAPLVAGLARDRSEDLGLRHAAAAALADIATQDVATFRALLEDDPQDRDEDLKGVALRALWPSSLSAAELFRILTPPRRRTYFGAYVSFIHSDLAQGLKPADLPIALRWVRESSERRQDYHISQLFEEIMQRGCENLADDAIAREYVELALFRLKKYEAAIPRRAEQEDRTRHRLVSLLLPKLAEQQLVPRQLVSARPPLFSTADLPWLLEELDKDPDPESRLRYADLAAALLPHDPDAVEPLRSSRHKNAELQRATAYWFDRERELSQELFVAGHEKQEDYDTAGAVRALLEELQQGNSSAWWELNLALCYGTGGEPDGSDFDFDLRTLPGWKVLEPELHERIVSFASWYLANAEPAETEWFGINIFHRPAAAGVRALALLFHEAPERFATLSTQIWEKWLLTLLAHHGGTDAEDRALRSKLIAAAYRAAPERAMSALEKVIELESRERTGTLFVLRLLENAWDDRLATRLLEKAKSGVLGWPSVGSLFEELLPRANAALRAQAAQMIAADEERLPVMLAFLRVLPEFSWDRIWSLTTQHPELGAKLWLRFAMTSRFDADHLVRAFGPARSGELFIWLMGRFPFESDPKFLGAHVVGEREAVGTFRDALLRSIQYLGTRESVGTIQNIQAALGFEWLTAVLQEAKAAYLQQATHALPVQEILNI